MKLDKDFLLKNKFWVLLLVSLPLTLAAIFLLVTSVSGDIKAAQKKLDTELNKYKKAADFKTPKQIEEAKLIAEAEKKKEIMVWSSGYKMQEELFFWPKEVEDKFDFRSGLFAQKVTVYRGQAQPPATAADRVLQGTVKSNMGQYIVVEDKDKRTHKVRNTMTIEKPLPLEGDDKEKEIFFGKINAGDRVSVHYHVGKYFNEALTNAELSQYRAPPSVYLDQIDPILEQVEPMTEKGEGVVQLKDWFYKKGDPVPPRSYLQKFLTYMGPAGWQFSSGNISEEAWLAQEDLWIQKEMYRLCRLANDYVSQFENVDKSDNGEDKNRTHTFRNPFWEITFKWQGDKLTYVLKNLRNHRQKLDVKFRVKFSKDKDAVPQTVPVGGTPLGPGETTPIEPPNEVALKGTPQGIYGVEEALTWETAAVKRIDMISIGSLAPDEYGHGLRTFADGQKALSIAIDPSIKLATSTPAQPEVTSQQPFRRPRPGGGGKGGKQDPGGNELTLHGLIRNRYVEINAPMYRRIPVSLVLVVDQDHINRVYTAFSNSKLRFLTTQVLLNRLTTSIRPQLPDPSEKQFASGPRRWTYQQQQATEEIETSFEMALYGIVTLYERYPPPLSDTK